MSQRVVWRLTLAIRSLHFLSCQSSLLENLFQPPTSLSRQFFYCPNVGGLKRVYCTVFMHCFFYYSFPTYISLLYFLLFHYYFCFYRSSTLILFLHIFYIITALSTYLPVLHYLGSMFWESLNFFSYYCTSLVQAVSYMKSYSCRLCSQYLLAEYMPTFVTIWKPEKYQCFLFK